VFLKLRCSFFFADIPRIGLESSVMLSSRLNLFLSIASGRITSSPSEPLKIPSPSSNNVALPLGSPGSLKNKRKVNPRVLISVCSCALDGSLRYLL